MAINIAKIAGSKPIAIAAKAIGVATLASIIYDTHVNGREKANATDEVLSADRFMNLHKQYLTSSKESATLSKMKKGWFFSQMSNSCCHFWNKANGYIVGAANTIGNNLGLIALSALTLLSGKKAKSGEVLSEAVLKSNKVKSIISKTAGALVGASWIRTYLNDVVGISSKKTDYHY